MQRMAGFPTHAPHHRGRDIGQFVGQESHFWAGGPRDPPSWLNSPVRIKKCVDLASAKVQVLMSTSVPPSAMIAKPQPPAASYIHPTRNPSLEIGR
jgi:hypothetical protein